MKLLQTTLISAVIWFGAIQSYSAEQEQSDLNILTKYIYAFDSFGADFKQTVYDQSGEILEITTGIVRLKKPGKFFWSYQNPYSQYLISNGETFWIYDEDLEQVTINNLDLSIKSSPAVILWGNVEIEDNYVVKYIGVIDETKWLELTPKEENVEFNAIRLCFKNDELTGIYLLDSLGGITEVLFSNISRNQAFNASLFEFQPPQGIDIIDITQE